MPPVKRQVAAAFRTERGCAIARRSAAYRRDEAISFPAAFAVALLLVLHTFLTALAAGAHASPATLDAFGNPLCHGFVGFNGGDGTPADDHPTGDCCTFGCHIAAAVPLPVRVPVIVRFATALPVAWRVEKLPPYFSSDRSSIRSRGPPRFV